MAAMNRPLRKSVLGALAVGLALVGLTAASIAQQPADIVKYRQSIMKSHGAHIGAIVQVLKGEVPYASHVAAHARALHSLSLMVPDIFPEGSGVGDTRAKPEIWRDRAKFDDAAKAYQTAAGELVRVAESGDLAAIGAPVQNVGKACGGCHKPFRAKKK